MKKKMLVTAAVTLTLMGVAAGCGGKDIGEAKAKEIALSNAGIEEGNISRYQCSKDRDDGRTLYEIHFSAGDTEYEYEINASTGEILNYDTELFNNAGTGQNTSGNTDTSQNNTSDDIQHHPDEHHNNTQADVKISEADAKAAALERVPGATEQDLKIELDYDDGQYIYEGDIIYQQKEYEFEIDANTGNFLKWSEERA